jgi:hypothetical protein
MSEQATILCPRCGAEAGSENTMTARRIRGRLDTLCASCSASPAKSLTYNGEKCIPWQGEVDYDSMQPVDEHGEPYMPGNRLCGHQDCVRPEHVLTWQKLTAERFATTYRTGKRLNYEQLLSTVLKENRELQRMH